MDLLVVGSGFFGLTFAREAAERFGMNVTVIERRDHIGGNAYSSIDEATGVEVHRYGTHLFHTSNERVWSYVNRFTAFNDYRHRVYANYRGVVYPLPINLGTINQFLARPIPRPRPVRSSKSRRRKLRESPAILRTKRSA